VYPDEGCWGLQEGPESGRWIQRLWVIRGDRKAKYENDLGPVSNYPDATPIIYPSFGENSVAELQYLAEMDRRNDKWAKRRREMQAGSTLIADILRQEAEYIEQLNNRSQLGPSITVQRDDYPSQFINRAAKEKRDAARANYRRS